MLPRRLFLAAALAALVTATQAAGPTTMSVQVKRAEVRSTPSFLAGISSALNYGDRVMVLSQNGAWMKVQTPSGSEGWIHQSALTAKQVVLQAGSGAQTGASSGELALAGKGFNADVEKQFKAKNQNVSFAWVDRMEKFVVSPREVQEFMKDGGLTAGNGGSR